MRASLLFLRTVLALLCLPALAFCLFVIPEMASRDAAAHPETAYLEYPFMLSAYLLFSLFFIALYQAFKLLGSISRNKAFLMDSVSALKKIKYCAFAIALCFIAGLVFLIVYIGGDIAGIFTMSLICIVASSTICVFAALLEKLTVQVIRLKEENKLTI